MTEDYYCDRINQNITADKADICLCLRRQKNHNCIQNLTPTIIEHEFGICPHIFKIVAGKLEPVTATGVPHCSRAKWCGWKIFRTGCFNIGKCGYKQSWKRKEAVPAK